jgi:hypothetical protein
MKVYLKMVMTDGSTAYEGFRTREEAIKAAAWILERQPNTIVTIQE